MVRQGGRQEPRRRGYPHLREAVRSRRPRRCQPSHYRHYCCCREHQQHGWYGGQQRRWWWRREEQVVARRWRGLGRAAAREGSAADRRRPQGAPQVLPAAGLRRGRRVLDALHLPGCAAVHLAQPLERRGPLPRHADHDPPPSAAAGRDGCLGAALGRSVRDEQGPEPWC